MAHESDMKELNLPILVMSPVDVARLRRELTALDDFLNQERIRAPGAAMHLPRTSRLFEEFASLNHLNWLNSEDRNRAAQFLDYLKEKGVSIHISFASDPSAAFMKQLLTWLRGNIHPQLLVRVGLQPTLAAGCIVRTKNRVFDFSLRQRFYDNKPLLIKQLEQHET